MKNGIWAVILAAGESKRMNRPKLVLPYRQGTIISNVISNIPDDYVEGRMIVLGAWSSEILEAVRDLPVSHCFNGDYKNGMLSSVRCGIRSLPGNTVAAIFFPGDQPGIPQKVTGMLVKAWQETGKGIIISVHDGKRGHPVLIDKKYFSDINTLDDSKGLRELSARFPGDVSEVETGSYFVLKDIDTPEDYLEAIK